MYVVSCKMNLTLQRNCFCITDGYCHSDRQRSVQLNFAASIHQLKNYFYYYLSPR